MIDIVRDDLLLEIQTGNFASIKSKLRELVRAHQIRLVYPIAQEKWIVKQAKGASGCVTRRKSPKRGRVEELFWEMVSIPHLLLNPNFSIEVLLIKEEELRRHDRKGKWRRRGWVIVERRLLRVVDRRLFGKAGDCAGAPSCKDRGIIYHKRLGRCNGRWDTISAEDGLLST